MILSDRSIAEAIASGKLGIDPFDPKLIQPSSIDVRLDNKFLVFRNTKRAYIDVKQPAEDLMEMIEVGPDEPMFLHPHEFVLGSTVERVRMPDDLVARLEGRSSLGRLGVVIHSSLPYDSPVAFLDENDVLQSRPIGEIVKNRLRGRVVGFDRDTFEVGFHEITNWFEELPDRIYEVRLASGRQVQVTAGHNLFTLNAAGDLVKTPTRALRTGTRVAIPKWIPDSSEATPEYQVVDLVSGEVRKKLLCQGPTVERAFAKHPGELAGLLRVRGLSVSSCLREVPVEVLEQLWNGRPGFEESDRLRYSGGVGSLPAVLRVDCELAWLLGVSVARGSRRAGRVTIASTNSGILDRAQAAFEHIGQLVDRGLGSVTCSSRLISAVFEGLSMGGYAPTRRLPIGALGWPRQLVEALLDGLLDGDGSEGSQRDCVRTTSRDLVSDVLIACARLGRRAVAQQSRPARGRSPALQVVSIARNRHEMRTSLPDPQDLLVRLEAGDARGFFGASSLNNVEPDRNGGALKVRTLERIHAANSRRVSSAYSPMQKLTRLVHGDLFWDTVVDVVDTGRFEVVYDLEVRSRTRNVQNFLAGHGGVFVSNTAGFIDASFEGHVTLEISNLANLPIALYTGMRIGQLSFSLMTTPAERPYGPARGSKYSGQNVPTASRLYMDFQPPR